MKHTLSYIQNHPNPQWTRKTWLDLNGSWDFAFDPHNEGIKNAWFNGFSTSLNIMIPYAYQSPKSGISYDAPVDVVWYQKQIKVNPILNKRLLIHLEGSDFKTSIYINGKQVSSFIGAYHRLTADITDYVSEDTLIVIRVEDSFSAEQPRGKQRWKTPSYECFYVETTGIYKPVWLEYVGKTYLQHSKMTINTEKFSLEAEHTIEGDITNLSLKTQIYFKNTLIHESQELVKRNFFSSSHDVKSDDQTMKLFLWHPDNPNLYDVIYTLEKDTTVVDQVITYVGARRFEAIGNKIFLNSSPLYLKLVLDQGYFGDGHLTATEEELKKDILLMKEMGFNGARKHEKIEDQRFYYYADILGFLNWTEMPSFYEFSDLAAYYMTVEWPLILKQFYNHPSMMTWVIINESWGVMDINTSKKQQHFVDSLYYLTKSYDSTRFVISNDGWEHTHSDLMTLHNYRESYDELIQSYKDFDQQLFKKNYSTLLPKAPLVTGYDYHNEPIILSEFGGIAFDKDSAKGWGYGKTVTTEEDFLTKLSLQMKAIYDNNLFAGYCLTQLTDVQQEVNGLLTEDRKPKVPLDRIKKLNRSL